MPNKCFIWVKSKAKAFDAAVAGYSLTMIHYLLLIYLMNNSRLIGPLGPLFRDVSDTELMLQVTDQLWEQIKHAMFKSIDLFMNRIGYKYVIKLNDIIEDALFSFKEPLTAKV